MSAMPDLDRRLDTLIWAAENLDPDDLTIASQILAYDDDGRLRVPIKEALTRALSRAKAAEDPMSQSYGDMMKNIKARERIDELIGDHLVDEDD